MPDLAFDAETFGRLNAEDYDAWQNPGTTDEAVSLISEIAGDAAILELAIGTGRVALPLAALGHTISGFDASPEMLEKLRDKPGGAEIKAQLADMADFDLGERFGHAFVVFNTFFNLITQEAQIGCFKSVARHLETDGTFLVETFVPDLSRFEAGQRVATKKMAMDQVWLEAITNNPVTQLLEFQRIRITQNGIKLVPLQLRYAYPAEIDLMARLAGFKLESRWGGWGREPFTAQSTMHVSLYRLMG